MSPDDPLHLLLPRYLSNTLDEDDAMRFRKHLAACDECSAEEEFLVSVREQVDQRGEGFLEDHPSADRLVAFVGGELSDDEAAAVRRHLDICATCPIEAGWVSGQATGGAESLRPPTAGLPRWAWAAALAATVVVALTLPFVLGLRRPTAAFLRPQLLKPIELADQRGNVVSLRSAEIGWSVYFPVDLPADDFPAEIAIVDGNGSPVVKTRVASRDELASGQYSFVACFRRNCPPGDYTVRIESSGDAPPETIPFEVVGDQAP